MRCECHLFIVRNESKTDALELHGNLGCWDYEVPLHHEPILKELNERYSLYTDQRNLVRSKLDSSDYNEIADQNIQARLRDVFLMHFSNAFGAMPLSTGNKTESACGYYTHFDMNFSFAPIKDLYKYQVVQLAMRDSRIPKMYGAKLLRLSLHLVKQTKTIYYRTIF